MINLLQPVIAFCLLAGISKFLKFSLTGFLLLVSVPIVYFYPFSLPVLILSLLLALTLRNLPLFSLVLIVSLFVSGHQVYRDIAIENVTNSQRGEHPNFQTNITAKLLHNKSTATIYYLQNLNDRLSISTIFASGSYPNLFKYLPLGFLFPWYLIGLVLAIKNKYKEYLNPGFIVAISILLVLTSVFTRGSAEIFMFSLVWFICFESVEQLDKIPKTPAFFLFLLNLAYLATFLMSFKVFLKD